VTYLAGIAEIVEHAETYEPPASLPDDHAEAQTVIYTMARCWGVQVGRDELDIDAAYIYARAAAEQLEVHTNGARGWRTTMRLATFFIDDTAARTRGYMDVLQARAERQQRAHENARWAIRWAARGLMLERATPAEIEEAAIRANGSLLPRSEVLAVLADEWDRVHGSQKRKTRP
jgi:hypothetical protein